MRLPKHIGIIPDGNRRWAVGQGLKKEEGYDPGIFPGTRLYHQLKALGIEEMTVYGFTADNTKRPAAQKQAFTKACVKAADWLSGFLPVQSAYADFYVVDALWPDFKEEHVLDALRWYDKQDITLGG